MDFNLRLAWRGVVWQFGLLLALLAPVQVAAETDGSAEFPEFLHELELFSDQSALIPVQEALVFDVTSPLFSDHAIKDRFAVIPEGGVLGVGEDGRVVFPDGTMLVKSFEYSQAGTPLHIETRVLRRHSGEWYGVSYQHKDGTAKRKLGGGWVRLKEVDQQGAPKLYRIPSQPQCAACHIRGDTMIPIGPHLDTLAHTSQLYKRLADDVADKSSLQHPQIPDWNDDSLPGHLQARAYLHANCAHCHQPQRNASNTGLYLDYWQLDALALGINKKPVSAGPGTGGRSFVVVPKKPDQSILPFRMISGKAGIKMPDLGQQVRHQKGIDLVVEWIAAGATTSLRQ